MNTKSWNILDKFLSMYRLSAVSRHIKEGDVVLDLGCGVQHYLLRSKKDKFKQGYGLDYDIENAQKDNITLLNYKFQGRFPLEDNFFNKIFLLAVLEHIEEKNVQQLFAEFFRVLKKNGRVIITTPTPRGKPVLEFLAFKLKVVTPEEVTDHKHYYCPKEIHDLAKRNGLKVVKGKFFQLGLNSLYVIEKQ